MKTPGERIKERRMELGWSQQRLADEISNIKREKISRAAVAQWEAGTSKTQKPENFFAAAKAMDLSPYWVLDGSGDKLQSSTLHAPTTLRADSNVHPGPDFRGKVPLISWVRAGTWTEAVDHLAPGETEDWIDTTVTVRPHTFALRVVGDSMEPDFPEGILLVVEPDLDPQPGDYVIAKNGEEATFKKLVKDGPDWYLKPLNPRYPIKPLAGARIIGVIREAVRRFR